MKKLILLILLLCCFAALGACLWLRADVNQQQSGLPQEKESAAEMPTVETVPEPVTEPVDQLETEESAEPAKAVEIVPEKTEPDFLAAYTPVLDSYRLWLAGERPEMAGGTDRGDYYLDLGETGVSFLCQYVQTLGYSLTDMDGNGIPELLIGSNEEYQDKNIFDMFTLVDGIPQRVLVSSERVAYMLYPGNQILHRGSGGAAHNFMVVYDYSGTDLTMTEGVVMADEDHYYEITGETENIFDERLPGDTQITREEYFARTDVMEANEVLLQLQPLQ